MRCTRCPKAQRLGHFFAIRLDERQCGSPGGRSTEYSVESKVCNCVSQSIFRLNLAGCLCWAHFLVKRDPSVLCAAANTVGYLSRCTTRENAIHGVQTILPWPWQDRGMNLRRTPWLHPVSWQVPPAAAVVHGETGRASHIEHTSVVS